MPVTPITEAPLSPHWAFVVQLREGTALTPEALHGRIEHIVTGQAATFASLEEARAFMARVLTAPATPETRHTLEEGGNACYEFPRVSATPEASAP